MIIEDFHPDVRKQTIKYENNMNLKYRWEKDNDDFISLQCMESISWNGGRARANWQMFATSVVQTALGIFKLLVFQLLFVAKYLHICIISFIISLQIALDMIQATVWFIVYFVLFSLLFFFKLHLKMHCNDARCWCFN